jgi:phosphoribosylamine--glycine ligase
MMVGEAYTDINGALIKCPTPMTAGDYVLVMTGTGFTVQDARGKVYRRLERIRKRMPGSPMYRTDIGMRLSRQLPELQKLGYAKGLLFSSQQSS